MRISMKAARVNVNLTQKEAAAALKVSEKTLANWEQGTTAPRADKMPLICEVYNCKTEDIIFLP